MAKFVPLVFFLSLFIVLHVTKSEDGEVKRSLINFSRQVSLNNGNTDSLNWNMTTDPCADNWTGVLCDIRMNSVRKIVLDGFGFGGDFDVGSLCKAPSLEVLSVRNNSFTGELRHEIGNCKQLTHLLLSSNQFSGSLPDSISGLSNLKRLEISGNNLLGKLPNLTGISTMVSFLADNNELSGEIPKFDFSNFQSFNVSNNHFSGPIPDLNGKFGSDSFIGNPGLCGPPLPNVCHPSPSSTKG